MKNITLPGDQLLAAPTKPKRISAKVRTAIELMGAGDCTKIGHAAEKAGLSRERLLSKKGSSVPWRCRRVGQLLARRSGWRPCGDRINCECHRAT